LLPAPRHPFAQVNAEHDRNDARAEDTDHGAEG
jgi:hypothetical protein